MPVLAFELIEEYPDGRRLVRLLDEPLAGRRVVLLPLDAPPDPPPRPPSESPAQKSLRLLFSLLTPSQRAEWSRCKQFSVMTQYGRVVLGRMSDIGFWPTAGGEYRLCVVPKDGLTLPDADVWANLLLALQHDSRWFMTVANWRRPGGDWNLGPVPGISPVLGSEIVTASLRPNSHERLRTERG